MLRSIDKQSGETVESVLEKKRKVATVGRVGLGLTIFSTAGNHLAYAALRTRNSPPKWLMCARTMSLPIPQTPTSPVNSPPHQENVRRGYFSALPITAVWVLYG